MPTPDQINSLPDWAQRYIHDLRIRCDPADEVQERHSLKEQRDGLIARILGDNHGRGWRQRTQAELEDDLYIWLKVMRRGPKLALADKAPMKSDDGAKQVAQALAERLNEFAVFGADRPLPAHGAGQGPTSR